MPPDYLVITSIDSAVKTERIVRAKNSAGALRHVVADTISVRQAHIDDAMRLAQAGGVVEEAKDA